MYSPGVSRLFSKKATRSLENLGDTGDLGETLPVLTTDTVERDSLRGEFFNRGEHDRFARADLCWCTMNLRAVHPDWFAQPASILPGANY